jgi:type I restriction enzyme S subunit
VIGGVRKRVRVGEVLSLKRRPVVVDPDGEYEEVGVRAFGRGLFHKEPVSGATLGSKRVFWIEPGDLVISNVFAWEGAVAVASDAEAGRIGSHRFMTFVPVDRRIDTSWAAWFFQSEHGLELIRRASPGSAGRNRTLAIKRFEALEIPLPSIDDQRRIATRLDRMRQHASATIDAQLSARRFDKSVIDAAVWRIIEHGIASGWSLRALGDIAEINPRPNRLDPDGSVNFVPMAAVDQYTGSIGSSAEVRRVETIGSGYKQFKRGDIIFARITPCMQNGKTAIFDGVKDYGYGSTEFHVIRPGSGVRAKWLHRFLRTQEFRNLAARRLTGTAGQQRVSAEFLRTASIPTPPESEQDKVLLAIDRLLESGSALALNRAKASVLATAIEPAIINQAFGGLG